METHARDWSVHLEEPLRERGEEEGGHGEGERREAEMKRRERKREREREEGRKGISK